MGGMYWQWKAPKTKVESTIWGPEKIAFWYTADIWSQTEPVLFAPVYKMRQLNKVTSKNFEFLIFFKYLFYLKDRESKRQKEKHIYLPVIPWKWIKWLSSSKAKNKILEIHSDSPHGHHGHKYLGNILLLSLVHYLEARFEAEKSQTKQCFNALIWNGYVITDGLTSYAAMLTPISTCLD